MPAPPRPTPRGGPTTPPPEGRTQDRTPDTASPRRPTCPRPRQGQGRRRLLAAGRRGQLGPSQHARTTSSRGPGVGRSRRYDEKPMLESRFCTITTNPTSQPTRQLLESITISAPAATAGTTAARLPPTPGTPFDTSHLERRRARELREAAGEIGPFESAFVLSAPGRVFGPCAHSGGHHYAALVRARSRGGGNGRSPSGCSMRAPAADCPAWWCRCGRCAMSRSRCQS